MIEPGAFKNLDEFLEIAAGSHRATTRSSSPSPIRSTPQQDDKGLLITGRYHSTPTAQDARTVAKERTHAGKAVKGSIGYKVRLAEKGQRDGQAVRSLKEIDLFECSFVNLAANPAAELVHAKSLLTPEEARQLVAEFKAGRVLSAANLASMRGVGGHAPQLRLDRRRDPGPVRYARPAGRIHAQITARRFNGRLAPNDGGVRQAWNSLPHLKGVN